MLVYEASMERWNPPNPVVRAECMVVGAIASPEFGRYSGLAGQALGVLARLGFPRRDDRGARFDPTRHEAVATRPDPGTEADMVAEVVRPGYGDGDHQLRPAQVVVARPG